MHYKDRVHNFSAGPASIPLEVLMQAKEELLNWQHSGSSVMELSHRSDPFMELHKSLFVNIRLLLDVPSDFTVLLLPGGARAQFAAVPLNILGDKALASYCVTGFWSNASANEALKYCKVDICHNERDTILPKPLWKLDPKAAYLHYCDNESISGLEFNEIPNFEAMPLVSDMTSSIFTKQLDFNKLDLVYAAAQKNFGIAGVTLVLVRNSLLNNVKHICPSVYDYNICASKDSMYNTPATFSWYITDLYLKWMKKQGGVLAMQKKARDRSERIYQLLDSDKFYNNSLSNEFRSRINIVFNLPSKDLDDLFVREAAKEGLSNLKGHKAQGGIRLSLYNATEEKSVLSMLDFMQEFKRKHG